MKLRRLRRAMRTRNYMRSLTVNEMRRKNDKASKYLMTVIKELPEIPEAWSQELQKLLPRKVRK